MTGGPANLIRRFASDPGAAYVFLIEVTRYRETSGREGVVEIPSDIRDQHRRPKSIESLKGLLEQLGSTELSLPEAKRLRSQLQLMLSGSDPEGQA